MAINAADLVYEAQIALGDRRGIRWPASDLVRYLDDGQREIATLRPDATATEVEITLVAGVKQSLPATAQSAIKFLRNSEGKKEGITVVSRDILDASDPGWEGGRQGSAVVHVVYNLLTPRLFDVYPPAKVSTKILARVSAYPTAISAPSDPGLLSNTVSGTISLADEFKGALLDYMLERAFDRDTEYGGNQALASEHRTARYQALGVSMQAKTATKPKAQDTPAVAG